MKRIISIIYALTIALLTFAACDNAGADKSTIANEETIKSDIINSTFISNILSNYNITNFEIGSRETDTKKGLDVVSSHITAVKDDESIEVNIYLNSSYEWEGDKWTFVKCEYDSSLADEAIIYKPLTNYEFDDSALIDELISRFGFKDDVTYTVGEVNYQKTEATYYMKINAIETYTYATDYHEIDINIAFDFSKGYWSDPTYTLMGTTTEWNNKAYFAKELNATEYIAVSNEFLDGEMPTGYADAEILSIDNNLSAEKFFTEHVENQAVKKSIENGYTLNFTGLDYVDFAYCAAGTDAKGEAIFIGKDAMAVFDKDCYTIDDSKKNVTIDLKELIFISYIY